MQMVVLFCAVKRTVSSWWRKGAARRGVEISKCRRCLSMPPRRPAAAATAATAAATEVRFQRRGDIYYWSAVVEILYSTAWRCTLL